MQALVQFSDANTASAAKSALEGRSIPRYDNSLVVRRPQFLIVAREDCEVTGLDALVLQLA